MVPCITSAQESEAHEQLRAQLSQGTNDLLVPSIEFYKTQNHHYPETLDALQATLPQNSLVSIFDSRSGLYANEFQKYFHQRVGDNHYYLRSLGPDRLPFASDDIVPQMKAVGNMGLLLEK